MDRQEKKSNLSSSSVAVSQLRVSVQYGSTLLYTAGTLLPYLLPWAMTWTSKHNTEKDETSGIAKRDQALNSPCKTSHLSVINTN